MIPKTERLAIRVSKATKTKLERMAKEENRSMSNYIENILIQNLEEKEMTIKNLEMYKEFNKVCNEVYRKTGKMASDGYDVEIDLIENEFDIFTDFLDEKNYFWEREENNKLRIRIQEK